MPDTPDIAAIAALVSEPARARMLTVLMDGRARTATELALEGRVTPSTASSHLSRMTAAGLLAPARQGRHRYFGIASDEVAAALEGLMAIAPSRRAAPARPLEEEAIRRARVCYDHLAGEAGVRLLHRMGQHRLIDGGGTELGLTAAGEEWCRRIGIDLAALRSRRRRLCRPCLDWSERRMHLAGSLGAALFARLVGLRHARRLPGSRAVALSSAGERFVERLTL
jgi:DNA-binding transcriptional ArsR family regulator